MANSIVLRFTGDNKGLKDTIEDSNKSLRKFQGSIVPLAAMLGGTAGAGVAAFAALTAASVGAAAAIGGIGVAMAAQDAEVKEAFAGIGEGLTSTLREASAGYVPLLRDFASDLDRVVSGPVSQALTSSIQKTLPVVESLLDQVPGIIEALLPVFTGFVDAGTPVLQMISNGLTPAITALAGTLTPLGPAVAGVASGLGDQMGGAIPRLLASLGPLLTQLIELGGPVLGALLPPILNLAAALLEDLAPVVEELTPTITWLASGLGDLITFIEPLTPLIIGLGVAYAVWTAAQWAINIAMTANPIGLIIVGIGALIAAIALIATKTTWFQDAWRVSWNWIKDTATSVADWVTSKWNSVMNFITGLPARIRSAASGMWDGIKDAFRGALNWIIGKWNGLGFTLPSFSAFGQTIGGTRISVPKIPYFHAGGLVPGAPGSEIPAILQAGERVQPIRAVGGSGGSEPVSIVIRSGGAALDDLLVEVLGRALRVRGVQIQGWTV